MSRAAQLMSLIEELETDSLCPDCDVEDGEVTDIDPATVEEEFVVYEDAVDEESGEVYERMAKIIKVHNGVVTKIQKVICPPGYRSQGGKCVKMTAKELAARKKAGKKASKKSHTATALRSRAKSLAKRDKMGI